jgi:hypothetical protein
MGSQLGYVIQSHLDIMSDNHALPDSHGADA